MATGKWVKTGASTLSATENKNRKGVKISVPAIYVELTEISWKSGIDTARDTKKIAEPHWKKGEKLDEEDNGEKMRFPTGSQRPGVYLVARNAEKSVGVMNASKDKHSVAVKLKVNKSTLTGSATLYGKFEGLEMRGTFPAQVGEHVVTLEIRKPPKACKHFEGDATWTVEVPALGLKPLLEKTRLEVFFILDTPISFYGKGVWIEALRLGFKKAKIETMSKKKEVANALTLYCHTSHGMVYDTVSGGSLLQATLSGARNFLLMNYITHVQKIVNC